MQKSNIMDVAYDREVEIAPIASTLNLTPDVIIDINTGQDASGATSGTGWSFSGGLLTIDGSGPTYKITGSTTANRVVVAAGTTANIILSNASISSSNSGNCAFDMNGADVTLILEGSNTLSSSFYHAGLEAQVGSKLTIYSATGGQGTLDATGGLDGAGIGGGLNSACGDLVLNGGVITARGGVYASGIGSGPSGYNGVGNITINGGTVTANGGDHAAGIGGGGNIAGTVGGSSGNIAINGGTITANGGNQGAGIGGASNNGTGGNITISGGTTTATGSNGGAGIGGGKNVSGPDGGRGADVTVINGSYNLQTGIITAGGGTARGISGGAGAEMIGAGAGGPSGTIRVEPGAMLRTLKTIAEISTFYNANGVFAVRDPQTITIYQGDGKSMSVTLYADDTMYSVAKKINDAIAFGIGYGAYAENAANFCTISDGHDNTSESIFTTSDPYSSYLSYDANGNAVADSITLNYYKHYYATMLVRSAIPGALGELHFSGNEDLLNALGLSTIQQPRESEFSVTIYDAHSGKLINETQTVSGNIIYGAITDNIDVKFDPLANINISWNEKTKRYNFNSANGTYTTFVHLADNSTTLQIGANEGEDFTVLFTEITSYSLGLDGLLTVSREAAARAITIIDNAIDKVSTQRATLGAYQNRLEHTITNLTTASTNTTAAESRIRDADMSKEMLNFTRLQILMQSGTSMLAQANQLPQTVISLIRG
ncbi:hypothetical protein AGMMS50276_01110 [Synergistales bacterium]|nr:hypothetical protein AGMMS50276_01110 [Synergistales bacterium]